MGISLLLKYLLLKHIRNMYALVRARLFRIYWHSASPQIKVLGEVCRQRRPKWTWKICLIPSGKIACPSNGKSIIQSMATSQLSYPRNCTYWGHSTGLCCCQFGPSSMAVIRSDLVRKRPCVWAQNHLTPYHHSYFVHGTFVQVLEDLEESDWQQEAKSFCDPN